MENDRNVDLEELFDSSRVYSTLGIFSLLVYVPVGLVLFIIRFFIGLHVFLITIVLPKHSYLRSLILRPLLCILGMFYTHEGTDNLDPHCKVLVANYTTSLDHAVLHLALPHHLVSVWDYSALVEWLLGCLDLGAKLGKEVLVANAKKHIQSDSLLPLLTFPESETTNGRVGLLKFSSWSFALDQPIQPIIIKISRPFFPVSPCLLNSFLLSDLFWMLFLPATVFHITYLPVQESTGDSLEDANHTQSLMATRLGVVATSFNSRDKLELIKKMNFQGGVGESEVVRRTEKKDKDQPLASKDRDVLSEGLEAETPPKPSPLKPVFEKNSYDRHLSFQEKKTLMIEIARKRYLENNSK